MSVTIRHVADKARVSVATVSRVFNSPEQVRPETREKVLAAAQALQFLPNDLGRQLRGGETRLIGLLLPTLLNPVFAECAQGIEEQAARAGFRILMTTCNYDPTLELAAVETFLRQRVAGMILTVADAAASPAVELLESHGAPYVLAFNETPLRPSASVDNEKAACEAVSLLLAAGHRHVAMLSGDLQASDRAIQRHQGYCRAMRQCGLEPLPLLEIDFDSEGLPPDFVPSLKTGSRPVSAVFCGNDRLAMLFIQSVRAAGLRTPQDFSVIGFDGLPVGELFEPALASVVQPTRELGAVCWRLLEQRMAGERPASVVLPHAIRRGGTVLPVSPDNIVV
ncbi:substrate-binding domain-containing protein [Megalodesulfovibrio paquesii]